MSKQTFRITTLVGKKTMQGNGEERVLLPS